MRGSFLVLLLAALSVSACASADSRGVSGRTDMLMRWEIAESIQSNAFDLVRQMRPTWLRVRGPNSINSNQTVTIYLDGVRMGGVESLYSIPVMTVEQMRFLSPPEAQSRFGLNNTAGAIAVTTRVN